MEAYLQKVMVDYDCPDCGGARLRKTRSLVRIADKTLPQVGELHLRDLKKWLATLNIAAAKTAVAATVVREIDGRLDLLIGIGLDYLNLSRRSDTLSGGESQRIRLSTQIGSGLMGMLYVLDEPSIGLHPKDNVKMIRTLERLRDLGNTVIGQNAPRPPQPLHSRRTHYRLASRRYPTAIRLSATAGEGRALGPGNRTSSRRRQVRGLDSRPWTRGWPPGRSIDCCRNPGGGRRV